MSNQRPKRDTMSLEEATVSNICDRKNVSGTFSDPLALISERGVG